MDNIKTSGNYIAVKVPNHTHDFSLRTKDGKSIKRLYWNFDLPDEGFIEFKPLLPIDTEITGLLSSIRGEEFNLKPSEIPKEISAISSEIQQSEWNQWLILKRKE